jgi:hypothetical protein
MNQNHQYFRYTLQLVGFLVVCVLSDGTILSCALLAIKLHVTINQRVENPWLSYCIALSLTQIIYSTHSICCVERR